MGSADSAAAAHAHTADGGKCAVAGVQREGGKGGGEGGGGGVGAAGLKGSGAWTAGLGTGAASFLLCGLAGPARSNS